MQTLSICVVTKNEAHNIVDCLSAVSWANEIVVIDSMSTDNTVELCKKFTDKVIVAPWLGCGPQKKQVFSMATSDWVLMLDADERVTPELAAEIKQVLANPNLPYNGYQIPFQSYFCGKKIRFGDWYNEQHLRLFKRTEGEIIPRLIHFGTKVNGRIGKLTGKIIHYSFPNVTTVINKMNNYSTDGAKHKFSEGKTTSIWSAIGHGLFAFLRGYIFKLGFLDGRQGFMLAVGNAEGSYYKYLKLLELQQHPKTDRPQNA